MAFRSLPQVPNYQSPHFRAVRNFSTIERLEERSQRRECAIQDLIDCETQYNVLLGLLLNHYVFPLSDYKTINSKQHKTLFPALHSIKELSDKFLDELKQRRINWNSHITKLSDLFDRFTPFFRMYQQHVNNHEKALNLLQELSQNKRWILFCSKAQIHCQRISLSDLLILPSEQLMKYDDVLSTIVSCTSRHHPDYKNSIKSQQSLNHEVESMKLIMVEYNRKENVRKIERRFKGKIHLLQPHRSFICEGKLWKISARSNKDRIYTFFLFNDLLIYGSSFGTKYKIHNMLPINDKFEVEIMKANELYGIDKNERMFCIKSEKKSIIVYADTIPIAQEWILQLNQCIDIELGPVYRPAHRQSRIRSYARINCKEERHTKSVDALSFYSKNKKSNTETLPVWVPDHHVTNCSICNNKFTFTMRKHHCRKCGCVACNKCSKYKMLNAEGVKQRACKRCFAINNIAPNDCKSAVNNKLPVNHPAGNRAKSLQVPQIANKKYKRSMTSENPQKNVEADIGSWMFSLDALQDNDQVSDDSDASDFANEIACLHSLPYYVESGCDFMQIFTKFGCGIGSFMLVPSAIDFDEYYSVNLVVCTSIADVESMNDAFEIFKISLFEKQRKGIIFRLEKKSQKTRDFNDMNKLLRYLEQKENLKFTHPIYRSEVEIKCENHSIQHIYVCDMERYPKAQTLYDYESKTEGDLTFKAGETICVWDKFTDDISGINGAWWRGVIGDRVGLFPSNYVQIYGDNNINNINNINDDEVNMMSGVYDEVVDKIDIYDVPHHGTVIQHHYNSNMTIEYVEDEVKQHENERESIHIQEDDEMDSATRYFYVFLKTNKLEKYFAAFKENECCDIRDIEYLLDDKDFIRNEIGIKNPIHMKKLMGEFNKLKEKMDEFKNSSIIPHVLIERLLSYGIITMDLLCAQIEYKYDLERKFNIVNENQLNLLWNIIDIQINPRMNSLNRVKSQTEGRQLANKEDENNPPKAPPAPDSAIVDDKKERAKIIFKTPQIHSNDNEEIVQNHNYQQSESDAASIEIIKDAKIVFITPQHNDDEEGSIMNIDNEQIPPAPPAPEPPQ